MSELSLPSQISWYVVYSKPKQEFRALEQLENQGFVCFLPTLHIEKITGARRSVCVQPLFSRYLFIRLDAMAGNWSSIRNTRGVTGLVKFGDCFASLPDEFVDTLKNGPQILLSNGFEVGERVAITEGPFGGLEGVYQAADGEARALILIEMLSQPQRLSFAKDALRKAA
jgi:transcriptional antiterminator RfaH